MTTHVTKQEIHGGSTYHRQKHDAAVSRVAAFLELRAQGLTYDQIGAVFGCTGKAVEAAIRLQARHMK